MTKEGEVDANHSHSIPFFAQDLGYFARTHHVIGCRDLWPTSPGEDHEGVHGPLRGAVHVEGLRGQGSMGVTLVRGVLGRVLVVHVEFVIVVRLNDSQIVITVVVIGIVKGGRKRVS